MPPGRGSPAGPRGRRDVPEGPQQLWVLPGGLGNNARNGRTGVRKKRETGCAPNTWNSAGMAERCFGAAPPPPRRSLLVSIKNPMIYKAISQMLREGRADAGLNPQGWHGVRRSEAVPSPRFPPAQMGQSHHFPTPEPSLAPGKRGMKARPCPILPRLGILFPVMDEGF